MAKFTAIVFAYLLSISSAFASDTLDVKSTIAQLIANDQGIKQNQIRVVILKGERELAAAKNSELRILSLKIDAKFDNFYAIFAAGTSSQFVVNGKFEKVRQVPIVAKNILKGTTITKEDIAYIDVNERIIARGVITDEAEIIGKGAARNINSGKPIMPAALTAPTIINRGNIVLTYFKNDALTIADNLEAMEDGQLGKTIRLKNINSNKIVRAKVTGENIAELTNFNQLASN